MKSSIFDQKIDPRASFPDERKSPQAVELIVSIVDRGRGESVVRLLERQGSLFHTIVLGRGTAQERILDYLGLGETEKDVVISGIVRGKSKKALKYLLHAMQFGAPGRGIAFTVPISSVSGRRALAYLKGSPDEDQNEQMNEGDMVMDFKYSLIFAIVNRGFTDLVVEGALAGGARGGTILYGKGAGIEEASDFFGISIVPEKEIVLILSKKEDKNAIMREIIKTSGLSTPAHGISFSVPVGEAGGMAQMLEEEMD